MAYKLCAIIPTHNHFEALPKIIASLQAAGLDIFIVDDGSNEATREALQQLSKEYSFQLLSLPANIGKGGAMQAGFTKTAALGYTHALQIDADGQHSLATLADFIALSKKNPLALLSGQPIYDQSMPLARKIGRWFTHVWVWIETLSFQITDSMCGYRIYPLQPTMALINKAKIGQRMEFDTEIMVRLFWQGTPVLMHQVRVTYPEGNLSNFDVLRDNWRITKMHTKLFFTMLTNCRPKSWATMEERGTRLGLLTLAWCYRLLGRRACLIIGAPVVFYFYLTGRRQRQASHEFLKRVIDKPGTWDGLRHFMNFFQMMLDKFAAWMGRLDINQIDSTGVKTFQKIMSQDKGGLILVSHLGNMELCRAASSDDHKVRLHVLLHTKNSQFFSWMLKVLNPQSAINIIEVTEVGPDTIIYLQQLINQGEWVVIAADRVPVVNGSRTVRVPFLGADAAFSQGPYLLASLLECPVYTAIAVREGAKLKLFPELFSSKIVLERGQREESIKRCAQQYAQYLEGYCRRYPYQWFNFFDFWR